MVVTGIPLHRTLKAAELLAEEGIQARVVEMHTLKPFDEKLIISSAEKTGALVTVEEHSIIGGLFGAVNETLIKSHPVPVAPVGIQDMFMCTAPDPESLWDYCGLRPEDIARAAGKILSNKPWYERA